MGVWEKSQLINFSFLWSLGEQLKQRQKLTATVLEGNNLEVIRQLPNESVWKKKKQLINLMKDGLIIME